MSSSEEDEYSEEERALKRINTTTRQDTKALVAKIKDIALDPKLFDVSETLAFENEFDFGSQEGEDVEDDLQLEVAFYNSALSVVAKAQAKLDKLKVPHRRPTDYFAEMVKSDEHMGRVKQRLLFEKQKMESFDRRKEQQLHKRRAKEVVTEKRQFKEHRKAHARDLAAKYKGKASNFSSNRETKDAGPAFKKQKRGPKKRPGKSKRQ